MTGRHRVVDALEEERKNQNFKLWLLLGLAVIIALAGVLAVVLFEDVEPTTVIAPTPVVITKTTIPLPPAPTRGPRPTEEVWRSCQAKATNSAYPGTDATQCMIDYQTGMFMSCMVGDREQCPEVRKP